MHPASTAREDIHHPGDGSSVCLEWHIVPMGARVGYSPALPRLLLPMCTVCDLLSSLSPPSVGYPSSTLLEPSSRSALWITSVGHLRSGRSPLGVHQDINTAGCTSTLLGVPLCPTLCWVYLSLRHCAGCPRLIRTLSSTLSLTVLDLLPASFPISS